MHNDDSDIDALLGAVVGGNGQIVEFPAPKERPAKKQAIGKVLRPAATNLVERLSAELADQLEASEAERAFIDPRSIAVRFSNLKHIARSPLHYFDAVQLDRDDTLAMRLGRGAHAMVLGLPVVKWNRPAKNGKGKAPRNGAEWEKFKADHPDAEILNAQEWAAAEGIANAIRRHPIAAPLLFDGTTIEETIEWEWLGRRCSSRPDARRGSAVVVDLKTTQCAEPAKFSRDAMYRGYNAQLAFYGLAVQYLTGRAPDDLYVVAVESKRPYAITVLRIDDNARLQGEKLCRLWMERLLTCEASNHWPAYTDAIATFSVPSEGDPDAAIDLDELEDENSEAWA
jgi:hypothetical protein